MKEKIQRVIDQILHVFFVFFGIRILFDYFWEGTVNNRIQQCFRDVYIALPKVIEQDSYAEAHKKREQNWADQASNLFFHHRTSHKKYECKLPTRDELLRWYVGRGLAPAEFWNYRRNLCVPSIKAITSFSACSRDWGCQWVYFSVVRDQRSFRGVAYSTENTNSSQSSTSL